MKLLENATLDSICSFIKTNSMDITLDVRIESYSCKMVSTDKKEWKKSFRTPEEANELQPLSPPEDSFLHQLSSSPFSSGRLRHSSEVSCSSDNDIDENGQIVVGTVSRRTLFNLVSLLNLSYNDYDFSHIKSESFSLVQLKDCMNNVNDKFTAAVRSFSNHKDDFWKAIDVEIKLKECIIYSYIPEYSNDPFTEDGCIWTFNYLCWNKVLKRILFLSCRALRPENLDISSEQLWVDE
ncbi:unnamed protein product [Bursaphelenchus xylophilus]|uniref:Repressor of RNA polymerase III transcription MAF1 n=1 Tax=Bursaphelenchus xylophilus TaxID=6326 RepID=A0A1I7SA98_BURXY|nr:unnamed protein product [Bursaphelenchus xylophilus]CAG9084155.1 unnamed protein product [Bursaphelenchus xylophilus]